MIDLLLLFASSFALGAFVAYAWWSSVRVTFLQEELFLIRDDLWRRARELNAFDDPDYLAARKNLNSMIRMARLVSARSMDLIASTDLSEIFPAQEPSGRPEVFSATETAKSRAVSMLVRYALHWTAGGVLRRAVAAAKGRRSREKAVVSTNSGAARSPVALRLLDELERASRRMRGQKATSVT